MIPMLSLHLLIAAAAAAEPGLDALARSLEGDVAALRGWEWKAPVQHSVQTVEQMKAALSADSDIPPETTQILALLGLIPATYDLRASVDALVGEQVAGYYDPESKSLVMVDRYLGSGGGEPDVMAKMLMVHELAHALDDQYVDLQSFFPKQATFDQQIAYRSLVEGSASASMVGWLLQGIVSGRFSPAELLVAMKGSGQFSQKSLTKAPPILKAELLLPYLAGTSFLLHGHTTMDLSKDSTFLADVFLRAAVDPPQSTEQILHPAKYWDTREAPVIPSLQTATAPLAAESFGEAGCIALLDTKNKVVGQFTFDHAPDVPACAGWGGDHLALLSPDRALWLVAWDTPQDRSEFLAAWKKQPVGFAVGERAWLFGPGMGREELEGHRAGIGMEFRQGGEEWRP